MQDERTVGRILWRVRLGLCIVISFLGGGMTATAHDNEMTAIGLAHFAFVMVYLQWRSP